MFRNCLLENIPLEGLQVDKLVGRYVPNLVPKPFEISKEYITEVYELTGSPRLKSLLDKVSAVSSGRETFTNTACVSVGRTGDFGLDGGLRN